MHAIVGQTFSEVLLGIESRMVHAPVVRTERWQGVDVRENPAAATRELMNVEIEVPMRGIVDPSYWAGDIRPNLPWADDHFLERTGGEPLNPGVQWSNWPWGRSAGRFRDGANLPRFNHTYAERLWPKYARYTTDGRLPFGTDGSRPRRSICPRAGETPGGHRGIAWEYGDLQDVAEMLVREPHTRQAWIPLFFPEDTGTADGGRKPCTLGYHFIVRDDRLSLYYPLRSCDLIRHFRDDCYLAVRLLLWMIDLCRSIDESGLWVRVLPGTYSMHCTSLHVFTQDEEELWKKMPPGQPSRKSERSTISSASAGTDQEISDRIMAALG